MVLIWTKEKGKRLDIIIVPISVLKMMIDTHIERKFKIGETKTCLVTKDNGWIGVPKEEQVIKLLKESLFKITLVEGFDKKFDIPHHIFSDIKCREFTKNNFGLIPSNEIFEGYFKITLSEIDGRARKTMEILSRSPWVNISKSMREEIISIFKKFEGKYPKEFVFLIEHIHPVKS